MLLISSLKNKTKKIQIRTISDPEYFYIPLKSYRSEMKPVVEIGAQVKKIQLLAKSDDFFSSSIHAPVSGIISEYIKIDDQNFIVLKNDFQNDELPFSSNDYTELTTQEFIQKLSDFGVEGSGGARFPTHVKYNNTFSEIETFIINGVECEPYLSADYVLMKEQTQELMKGLQVVQYFIKAKKIVVAIEKQNKELSTILLKISKEYNLPLSIKLVKNNYPQGSEQQLIKSITGKEIKKGEIPSQHGILVNNVGTIWSIYKAFYENIPFTERIITLSGNNKTKLGNYLIKIGTPIEHILKETQSSVNNNETVVLGGAMMGKAVKSLLTPINKGSGGILLLKNKKTKSHNCISCGYCVDVCPQRLLPLEFLRSNSENQVLKLKELNVQDCIECGACAYVCPSDLPLMDAIFKGKKLLHNN
ncbi:electron transport complex subunit RsxC [Chryseobacterium sp. MYb264]|uniref:electron transport complex subunit RsxC n=1 Tax=Chryseobacterium sp. MYb264 TaxID=2745153 RepID=UPI002E12D9D9|nr:electron transport complex subunit RsxC [Chryseobacterium sp. MYb264]